MLISFKSSLPLLILIVSTFCSVAQPRYYSALGINSGAYFYNVSGSEFPAGTSIDFNSAFGTGLTYRANFAQSNVKRFYSGYRASLNYRRVSFELNYSSSQIKERFNQNGVVVPVEYLLGTAINNSKSEVYAALGFAPAIFDLSAIDFSLGGVLSIGFQSNKKRFSLGLEVNAGVADLLTLNNNLMLYKPVYFGLTLYVLKSIKKNNLQMPKG